MKVSVIAGLRQGGSKGGEPKLSSGPKIFIVDGLKNFGESH